jgi:hypothetical protein
MVPSACLGAHAGLTLGRITTTNSVFAHVCVCSSGIVLTIVVFVVLIDPQDGSMCRAMSCSTKIPTPFPVIPLPHPHPT